MNEKDKTSNSTLSENSKVVLGETREGFFESLKRLVTNWRIAYERRLTGTGDDYLVREFDEELDTHFRDGRFEAAYKEGLISQKEYQDTLGHCADEWVKLKEAAEKLAEEVDYLKRLTGQEVD